MLCLLFPTWMIPLVDDGLSSSALGSWYSALLFRLFLPEVRFPSSSREICTKIIKPECTYLLVGSSVLVFHSVSLLDHLWWVSSPTRRKDPSWPHSSTLYTSLVHLLLLVSHLERSLFTMTGRGEYLHCFKLGLLCSRSASSCRFSPCYT